HKGRVLADSFVHRGLPAVEFFISSYFSPAAAIQDRLEAYIIADDVVIENLTERWRAISLVGPSVEEVLASLSPDMITFRGRRTQAGSLEIFFPADKQPRMCAELLNKGFTEISASEIERLRITDGVPAVPQDIGPNELPNEGGLESSAISYTKGCYLGQEVMARLKAMGQVRRRLLCVRGSAETPALPAPLFLGDRKVGELRSAVSSENGGFIGLALLSLLQVKSGSILSFSPAGAPLVYVKGEAIFP
ncbi:MAG: hypothetical protein ABIY47_09690, partial [Opitutaceae bacterium]